MTESQNAKSRRRSRSITLLLGLLAGMLLIVVGSAAALWWMYTTPSGLRFVVLLNSRLNTSVTVGDVTGSLRDGFTASSLSVKGPAWSLQAADIAVQPYELRWRQRVFDFERVTARTATVEWVPSDEPATSPLSLAMPIDLRVRSLGVGELRFGARGDAQRVVNNIAADFRWNADAVLIERGASSIWAKQGRAWWPSRCTQSVRAASRGAGRVHFARTWCCCEVACERHAARCVCRGRRKG